MHRELGDLLVPTLFRRNIALYMLDHEGHGRSGGLQGLITSMPNLAHDFAQFTLATSSRHPGTPLFIMGESMGGAVAMLTVLDGGLLRDCVRGCILSAPLCGVKPELMPHRWAISALTWLAYIAPTLPATPLPDMNDLAAKHLDYIAKSRANPLNYHGRMRLRTALELHYSTLDIEKRFSELTVPLLILHGGDDDIISSDVSRSLHEAAQSTDKSLFVYEGFWHGIFVEGLRAAEDVAAWIEPRISALGK